MALTVKDRVKESSTTTGTSDFVLGGAAAGFQTFAVIGNTNTTYYAAVDQATGDWEVGVGTYSSTGPTLTRDTVLESSNSGSKVNFAAGSKDVFCTYPAERSVYLDAAGSAVSVLDIGTLGASTANITTANITAGTVTTTPTSGNDITNKTYVDTLVASGIHFHQPVRVESPINLNATYNNGTSGVGATLTNAGTQAALEVDGITVAVNDRVLVYEQTTQTQNGVYVVTDVGSGSTNWVLTRSSDADTYVINSADGLSEGSTVFVQEGTTGAGETYTCNTSGVITFGTTNITFAQISSAQIYSAGTGLTLSGTQFSITNTGTAGTYGAAATVPVITTNAQGQVTSVTPTAIAIAAAAVSGLAPSATTDTTNAANITSGTLPVARLNGSYTGITGVGTLAAGTWNGSTVAAAYGGTGQSSYTVGDLLYASGATALSKLADVAFGNVLLSGGVGTAPAWGKVGLNTHVNGTLAIGSGGTGATDAATARANLGAGTGNGSVTSVGGTGGYGGLTLSGTVTTSGNLTLGGTPTGTWPISISGSAASVPITTTFSGTYPVVVNVSGALYSNTGITYTGSTGTLAATTFSGALSGNATSATNATTAGGLAVNTTGVNNVANEIVRTNASGYAYFGWINTVSGVASGTPARVYCSQDSFIRYYDMATFTGYVQAAATGSWGISVTGSAATLTTARTINGVSFNGSAAITIPRVKSIDDRATSPADGSAGYATFGFGSWANNNTPPYADYWIMRSYSDASGGSDNMVSFRKDTLGMRVWQQLYGSASAFSTYADVLMSNNYSSYTGWTYVGSFDSAGVSVFDVAIPAGAKKVKITGGGIASLNNVLLWVSLINSGGQVVGGRFQNTVTPTNGAVSGTNFSGSVFYSFGGNYQTTTSAGGALLTSSRTNISTFEMLTEISSDRKSVSQTWYGSMISAFSPSYPQIGQILGTHQAYNNVSGGTYNTIRLYAGSGNIVYGNLQVWVQY